jgi:hypothetical protein
LYVSIPLKLRPTYSSLSSDGRYLAIIERVISPVIKLDISVIDMSDGSEAWNATLPILVGDSQYGPIVISSEGRAVAFAMFDSTETIPRLHVVRASGNHVRVPAYFHALAVGTDGLWAIAEPARNLRADDQQWSVLAAGNVTAAISAASAKGMAVIVSQEAKPLLQVVNAAGNIISLPQPMLLGPQARVVTSGEWLIVASGYLPPVVLVPDPTLLPGAGVNDALKSPKVAEPELDLLGNPIVPEAPPTQPPMMACYRWDDLANPASAKPVHTFMGYCDVSQTTPGLIFALHAGKVQAINLNDLLLTPLDIGLPDPFL